MESELRPRLCFLTKGGRGYGFHLHGERNKGGQFIRKVEPGSSADLSGLRAGDRVVEVNGENVESETHHQVVSRIQAVDHRTRLLVVDRDTDAHLRRHGLPCSEALAVELGNLSPRPSPLHTPSASPVPRDSSPSPPHLLRASGARLLALSARGRSHSPLSNSELPSETWASPAVPGELLPRVCDMVKGPSELLPRVCDMVKGPSELLPRVCDMVKGPSGYGFNLHSDKTRRGQFIRSIDPGSPAQRAGLRPADRLVEVNRVNIEGLRHSEVVALIQGGAKETRLLVVAPETDELFKRLGVTPTEKHVKEVYVDEPYTDGLPSVLSEVYVDELITDGLRPVLSEADVDEPITNCLPSALSEADMNEPIIDGLPTVLSEVDVDELITDGLRLVPSDVYVDEPITNCLPSVLSEVYVDEPITDCLPPVLTEVYVDEPITDNLSVLSARYTDEPITHSAPPTPSPTTSSDPPVISVILMDPPITNDSLMSRAYRSSASQSSSSSTTQSEFSSSDMSIQVPDDDERRTSDPFLESGLRLSPTAAEAKEKARSKRAKKRAPPMDWSKKQEIFSNF